MKRTALDIIREITLEVENRDLPLEIMVKDIQMMRFKIRPVIGDIASLKTAHYEFVRALWKIGRIDEMIGESLNELDEDDQEALIEYFQEMETEVKSDIRESLSLDEALEKEETVLKLEIFKDIPLKSSSN